MGAKASERTAHHCHLPLASTQGSSASSHLSFCTWRSCSVSQLCPGMLLAPAAAVSHSRACYALFLAPTLTPQRDHPSLLQMPRHTSLPAPSCPSQDEALPGGFPAFTLLRNPFNSLRCDYYFYFFAAAICIMHFRATGALWLSKKANRPTHHRDSTATRTTKSGNLTLLSSCIT